MINVVSLIAGTRQTGKTTFIKEAIKKVTRTGKRKVLIVDTFDNPVWRDMGTFRMPGAQIPRMDIKNLPRWRSGIYFLYGRNTKQVMAAIEQNVYNALVVFEDATKYIGTKLRDDEKHFVIDSKQKNVDLIFVFHGLTVIPRDLVRLSDLMTIFKTSESWNSNMKDKFPQLPVVEAFEKVNADGDKHANRTVRIGA